MKKFTLEDAKRIGGILGIDWTEVSAEEFKMGLNVELDKYIELKRVKKEHFKEIEF